MCPWSYKALLMVCSVPAVKATPGDRTQFSFHILMDGMAIRQDVIVGLLAAATVASAFSHNEGRSAYCPPSPQGEAAAGCRQALWSVCA